ncbi:TPA: hypothetical protein ACH3X1_004938 [Trebouxia sp. C0004]
MFLRQNGWPSIDRPRFLRPVEVLKLRTQKSQQTGIPLLVPKQAAVAVSLVADPDLSGEIPVLLPEKLSAFKCLVEVEAGTSTDLAGDAGAVGRFAMTRHSERQQAQLDLKGQMYHMNVVPCASTLCVLNIRQTEAKVEAIFPDYVQLRQDSGHVATQIQDLPYLYGDDDENYQEQGTGGAATSQGLADSRSQ